MTTPTPQPAWRTTISVPNMANIGATHECKQMTKAGNVPCDLPLGQIERIDSVGNMGSMITLTNGEMFLVDTLAHDLVKILLDHQQWAHRFLDQTEQEAG